MAVYVKALALVLMTGLAALLLKKNAPELALLLSLAAALAVSLAAANYAAGLRDILLRMEELIPDASDTVAPLVKCAGIGVVTKLGGALCRDCSQNAGAVALELLGTVCAFAVALPLLQSVLNAVGGFF